MDFETLKKQIDEIDKKRWDNYNLWKSYTELYKNLKIELESICDHKWVIDRDCFDPCRTQYKCENCSL